MFANFVCNFFVVLTKTTPSVQSQLFYTNMVFLSSQPWVIVYLPAGCRLRGDRYFSLVFSKRISTSSIFPLGFFSIGLLTPRASHPSLQSFFFKSFQRQFTCLGLYTPCLQHPRFFPLGNLPPVFFQLASFHQYVVSLLGSTNYGGLFHRRLFIPGSFLTSFSSSLGLFPFYCFPLTIFTVISTTILIYFANNFCSAW